MSHAEQRVIKRIIERAGVSVKEAYRLFARAKRYAFESRVSSEAILMENVEFQGKAWSEESNGNQVWAIIRNGVLVTIMFRRDNQPCSPEALRVAFVSRAN